MPKPAPTLHHLSVSRTARYAQYGSLDAPTWWMVLHGYGQRAEDFIQPFADIASQARFVLAPEALSRFYTDAMGTHQTVGASWMTRAARADEISDYIGYLDTLVAHLRPASQERPRVHVLGFSQGAATASRWALLGDAAVDRLTLWAGDLAHDLDLDAHAEALRQMDLTVVAGTNDPYVPPERLKALRERLGAHDIPATIRTFKGGHRLHRNTLREMLRDTERTSSREAGA